MTFKVLSFYFTLLAFLAGCMGGGNQELQEATFGMTMTVTPDNQTLEDPATLAQDIFVTVRSDDGSPSRDSRVTFSLLNPDSGAQLLVETCVTDKSGECSTQVIGGDDFGKVAQIKVQVAGTKLSKVIQVAIRTKIVPTKIQIMEPPSEIVAGKQFQIGLRLIDDNGRVAEDEEFNFDVLGKQIEVTARSIGDFVLDPNWFNKTAAVDRRVKFENGIAYIQGVIHKKAQDVTIELTDFEAFVEKMEAATGRDFRIDDTKTFRIVPDVPVRAQLQDMASVTTDDKADGRIWIFDQYDNHATNFGGVCTMTVSTSGDNLNEAYIVNQGDANLRDKTGIATIMSGVGSFDIRDTNVETATVNVDGINSGCSGITNLGTSKTVDFNVGAVAKIVIRQPAPPNHIAKTTEEVAVQIDSTDAGGNLTPTFSGIVGIDFNGSCSADINNEDEDVADTKNIKLSFGTKTIRVFNRYLDRKTAEECTMSLRTTTDTAEVADLTSTATLQFIPGDPAQFSFEQALTNGEVGWGVLDSERNRVTVKIEQLDTWGNPINEGGETKTVKVVSDGSSEINSSGLAKTVSFNQSGKGEIQFYNTKHETVNISFLQGSGSVGMRYTNANSENVSVSVLSTLLQAQVYFKWGMPSQVVMADPTDGDVDAPITVDFEVQDYGGNRVQDFGTVSVPRTDLKAVTDSGTVTLLDALSFVNGQSSVRITDTKEETVNISMVLNDGVTSFKNSQNKDVNYTASVQDAYFKWGSIGRKFLIEDPDDGTVDDGIQVKIQVVDKYNNPVRDYGCSNVAQDAKVNVTGASKVTTNGSFDHTNQTAFDALTQTAFVDIANNDCPINDPQAETYKDNSFGHVHIFVRKLTAFGTDFESVNVTMDDSAGTGYIITPSTGQNISFAPGAVKEYRMEDKTEIVDNAAEVIVNALDQFENRVVSYAQDDAVTFQWIFDGSTANKAYVNADADGIANSADDRATDGDGNVIDLFIDFKPVDRGVGKIYLSATKAETYQAGLAAKSGYITNNVANIQFNAGAVAKFDIAAITPVNSITTDAKAKFGVRALDQYNNVNYGHVDTNLQVIANKSMKILTNPNEVNPDNYVLGNPVAINISAGVGEFFAYDNVTETATLTINDTLGRDFQMIPLEVTWLHGSPYQVTISEINTDEIEIPGIISADTAADAPAIVKVQVQDKNGNLATAYQSSISGNVQLGVQPGSIDTQFVATLPAQDDLPSAGDANEMIVPIVNGEGQLYLLARKVGAVGLFVNPLSTGLIAEPSNVDTPVTVNVQHGATKKYGILQFLETHNAGGTLGTFPIDTVYGTTDDPIQMKVGAFDYYNNLATSDDLSEVQVNIDKLAYIVTDSWDPGSTGVGGLPYTSAKLRMTGGVGKFSIRDKTKESGIILSLSNPSLTGVNIGHTRPVNVTFGVPYYFAIIKPTGTTSVDVDKSVTVEVRDENHNIIDNGFLGEVNFKVNVDAFLNDSGDQDPNTGLPATKTKTRKLEFTSGNDGTATMAVWDRKAEIVTLSLEAGTGKNLTPGPNYNNSLQVTDLLLPSELKTLTFVPGVPDRFEIQNPSENVIASHGGIDYHSDADSTYTVEAKAYDKYNNFCNNYSQADAMQLTLTSGNMQTYITTTTSPNDVSSDNLMDFGTAGGFPLGVGRLVIRDKKKDNISVTLTDVLADGYTWTSNTVVVKNKWGAPAMFHLGLIEGANVVGNNSIKALRADDHIKVEAIAKDAYQNDVLDFTGKCDFTVQGTQVVYVNGGSQTIQFTNSHKATEVYEQRIVGNSVVRLVDNSEAPTMEDYNHHVEAQRTVVIIPGKPEKFGFIDPLADNPTLDIIAGNELVVTVEAQDKWGNRATSFDGAGADVQVGYKLNEGTGEMKDNGGNWVVGPLPKTFTGGKAEITLKNEILDRAVSGADNEPLVGETVTMEFTEASDTSAFTNSGSKMGMTNTLDITFYPNVAKRLEVVDFASAGPYKVDDPVRLRVEARDVYGNFTQDWNGSFTLTVDKDAWTYQGLPASNYKYLPTENLDGQDVGQKEQVYTMQASDNGMKYVHVANLTAELNVTINTKLASPGTEGGPQESILHYDNTMIGWTFGTGVYYKIVFTDQEGVAVPEFSTDKVRPVEVRVLDKGRNLVTNHPTHEIRMTSSELTKEFTGDDPGDDGRIQVIAGVGQFNYRTQDDVISTIGIDTAAPGLYAGVTGSTKNVKFIAGTVAQFVFSAKPLNMVADEVIISDQSIYEDAGDFYTNYPVPCTTSPGQQTCSAAFNGYPTKVINVEPQDKFGNINKLEGDTKVYNLTVVAKDPGANNIWTENIKVVNGIAWKDFTNKELFTQRLYKAQNVTFSLANPSPTSQPDEDGNSVTLAYSDSFTTTVGAGAATRLWIKPIASGTIDFPIPMTIEVMDAHSIDANGNGNLVNTAPDIKVGYQFYAPPAGATTFDAYGMATGVDGASPGITGAKNATYVDGSGNQKDERDDQGTAGNDAYDGSTLTVRKGVAIFNIESLVAEDVTISLFDSQVGTAEGAGGIYYSPLSIPTQPKTFTFNPGVPTKYVIILPDYPNKRLFDNAQADKLREFDFVVEARDKGTNFTPTHNGWANVSVSNAAGGEITVMATPDTGVEADTEKTGTDISVIKNVKVTSGLGNAKFKVKKSGTVSVQASSAITGMQADSTVHQVVIEPGPGYEVVIIDPADIAVTDSNSVADWSNVNKFNLSLLEIHGLDYFGNIATDVSGTIFLKADTNAAGTMKAIDSANNETTQFGTFTAGFPAVSSLRLRNKTAETVEIDLTTSSLKNSVGAGVLLTLPASPEEIVFSPGPTAQLSLEIDDSWDDNVKEVKGTTNANADQQVNMTVRARDIYGNWNQTESFSNEAQIVLTSRDGAAVKSINGMSANETLSISSGKVDFTVRLNDFSNDNSTLGISKGVDELQVALNSATYGFNVYNAGDPANGSVKSPRTLYYKAGEAVALTMDNPPDTDTDSQEIITIYARDQYGNVDKQYGSSVSCTRSVKIKVWNDAGHTDPASDITIKNMDDVVTDDICIEEGVAQAKFRSTRTGQRFITLIPGDQGLDQRVSAGTVSNTTALLNANLSGKGLSADQDIYISPGAPAFYIFTDGPKTAFELVDTNGGTPADITIDNVSGTPITVDSSVFVYAYAVDQGGNICTQFDSNDRINGSFDKDDAVVNTGDSLYGDFVDGELKFNISRQLSFQTDGLATLSLSKQAQDSAIVVNKLKVSFDHGKTTKFSWDVPAGDVSIDSIGQITIKARDQYDNVNDNYAGTVDITGTPNTAFTGDLWANDQPYRPSSAADNGTYEAGRSADVEPSDLNYAGAGQNLAFSSGQLVLEVMSLRAVGYTMTLANAQDTADSNGSPAGGTGTVNFVNGAAKYYEFFDPQLAGYDHYNSGYKNFNLNKSGANYSDDLTTDNFAKIGIHALDRGGNLVTGYTRVNAVTVKAQDTEASPSLITEKIDFVIANGPAYEGGSENTTRTLSFNGSPIIIFEMRAKLNIAYELLMDGLGGTITQLHDSTAGGNQKHVTFKNGAFRQVAFMPGTPSAVQADTAFQIQIEAQDQFGNKAENYDGFIQIAIDDTITTGAKVPADVDFPTDAVFPAVSGQQDGTIEITSGAGTLTGFEYHRTNPTSNRTITLYAKETDLDFDQSGGAPGNITTYSKSIVISAGTPDKIVFDGNPTSATVDQNAQFKLRVEDEHGNLCYNVANTSLKAYINGQKYAYAHKKFGGSTGVDVDTNGGSTSDSDGNDLVITNGSETFVIWSQKAESVDITLFNTALSLPTPTKSFNFIADTPKQLIFTSSDLETPLANGNIQAGQDYTIYAIARDQFQNTAVGYTGTAELRVDQNIVTNPASANANFPVVSSFTFTNGTSSMVVASETMTKPSALVFSFGNFTGSATITDKSATHSVIVDHFDAVDFTITAGTTSETIDSSVEFTLQAVDAYGNSVDDYSGKTVAITSSDNYAYSSDDPSTANDANSSLIYKTNSLNVVTNASGLATFDVATYKAGSVTMEVEAAADYGPGKPMANGANGSTTFTFGEAKIFRFQNPPTTGTVDAPVEVTVEARDRGGLQIDTNYTATDAVTASISPTNSTADVWKFSASPSGEPGSGATTSYIDFTSGYGKVKVRSKKNQDVDITLVDNDSDPNTFPNYEGAGNDKIVPFKFGAWHHMAFLSPAATKTTDDLFQFNVRAEDQYNNHQTDTDGTIKIVATNGVFQNGSPVTGGSQVIISSAGTVTLSGGSGTTPTIQVKDSGKLLLDGTGQNSQTVSFGFGDAALTIPNPSDPDSKTDVIVTHGELYQYFLESAPVGSATVGDNVTLSVRITDENGNLVWDLSSNTPKVKVKARVGVNAPNQLKADGSNCTACDKVIDKALGDFVDGYAEITYNSFKAQDLTFDLEAVSDGHASSTVAGTASYNYLPDVCQRFTFKHNNSTYSWTPSNPNNFGEVPAEQQKNGDVDNPISFEIAGIDKYGNLDDTCTESGDLTAVAVLAGDNGLIDWDTNYQPGSFTLSSGKKTVQLRNKKGHSNLKIRLGFSDKGASWGNDEKVVALFDHGAAHSLDISHDAPTLPKLTWTVDDEIPFTIKALDVEGNFNDNWTGTVQIYTNNNAEKGVGVNAGPFIAGAPAQNLVTTTVVTANFVGGQHTFNLENLNRSTFKVRMQGATGGVLTVDTDEVTLEPGVGVNFQMDQTADLNDCDGTGYWNTSPSNDMYWPNSTSDRGFQGCNPYNAMTLDSYITLTLRAYDRGMNLASNWDAVAPFDMSLYGNVASQGRIVADHTASAASKPYGDMSTQSISPTFDDGIATVYLQAINQGINCFDNPAESDSYTAVNRCEYRWGPGGSAGALGGSLDLRFEGCASCPTPTGQHSDFRFYFKAGGANYFAIANISDTTVYVDDTVDFTVEFVNQFSGYQRPALDFVGQINIVADEDYGCEERSGVTVDETTKELDGTFRVTGYKCTKIPRTTGGAAQLGWKPVNVTISSNTVTNDHTFNTIQWRSGAPVKYKIVGSTSGQVSPMNNGTKYQEVKVELWDQYENVTRASSGSVNLTFSSGDNTRVGYDFDGAGAPTLATAGQVAVTGFSTSDGDKSVFIKTDLAGTIQLGLNSPVGAPSVETNSHDMTFIPDIAVEYAVLHNDTGATTAVIDADSYTTVRVEARDQFGNIATTENNKTVSITGTGAGVQFNPSSVVTVNGGIGTTAMRKVVINPVNPASESMTVGMTGPSNGTVDVSATATFTCEPGQPAYAVVVASQASPNVQQSQDTSGIEVKFDLWDQFDNPTKPDSGSVSAVASLNQANTTWNSSGTTQTTLSWNAGHTIGSLQSRYIKTTLASNNHRVTMGSGSGVATNHATKGVRTVNIIHGDPHHWRMNVNDMGTIYVNTDASYPVETFMMDEWDNVCNTASAPPLNVTLASTVTGTPATTYVIDGSGTEEGSNSQTTSSGVANSSVRATSKTTISVQASGGGLASSPTKTINVRWGAPDHMVWTTFASNKATGDAPDSYIITMYDAFDNHITGYSTGSSDFSHLGITPADVRVTSLGFTPDGAAIGDPEPPTIGPTANQSWSGGVATYTLSGFESAGLFTISADDRTTSSIAPNKSGSINITPAGATKVWIAPPAGKGIVSQASDVTVYALDDFNNFADTGATIQICSVVSGTIPTGRYTDDSNTAQTRAYFENSGTYCKTQSFAGGSQLTFPINVDQANGYGFGWTEINFASSGGLTVMNTNGHEDFYFQPGDPVKYELILGTHGETGQPAANLFHSSVNATTRDASHLVTGVKRTVQIKAVDVTGAVASTWGGVATVSLGGDLQIAGDSVLVTLTQGEGSFDIYDQFIEDIPLRVIGTSDNTVSVYNQNNSGTACDTCEINLKVSRSKAQTFKVTAVNSVNQSWPDAAPNLARCNHNRDTNGDYFDITYEILQEGGARMTEYVGKFKNQASYWENFTSFSISNGIKTGQWGSDYIARSRTPTFETHTDYGSRSLADTGITNYDLDVTTYVHDSPDRIYVYCPVSSLISNTASIATCRMKIKDNQYHRSTTYVDVDSWGNGVNNFQGGRIELIAKDNTDTLHPNAIIYLDGNNNGAIDANESDGTFEGDRGAPKQVNFVANQSIYYFGVHSESEGNVEVSLQNGVYNGNKWHTYLGGSANTDIPFDGTTSPIKYSDNGSYTDQTIFFQAAPTTDMTMVVTGSDGNVNPSDDGTDEYYEIVVTARIANGSVNLNEDGYVYLDAQCYGAEQVGYLEDVNPSCGHYTFMKDMNSGGFTDTNSKLGQFVSGVATFRVYAEKVGDLKFHLRHPGSSSVAFINNDQVKRYDSNPATKYQIAFNYDTPGDGNSWEDKFKVIANGRPHTDANSYNRIEVRAVDAQNRIDINYAEANVPITIACAEVLGTDSCAANLTGEIDGNLNGTKGDNTVTFVNGRASFDILTTEVGEYTVTITDGSAGSYGAQTSANATFAAEWPDLVEIVELIGNRDTTVQGKVIFTYEAIDGYGNRIGDFFGAYGITNSITDGTLSGSSNGVFFNSGIGSYTIESSKGQVVTSTFIDSAASGVNITGDVDGTPTVGSNKFTFVGGKAIGIRISQHPIGNVKVDDVFEQGLAIEVIDADEAVVTTGVDAAIGINVTAYSGAGCVGGNEISTVESGGSSVLNKTTAAGTYTWNDLSSTAAQTISLKVRDANNRWPGFCSIATTVYDDLVVAWGGTTGSVPGVPVIFELAGGVPPLNVSVASSTDSTVELISTGGGCTGSQCVKWTPGSRNIASETITVTDSQTAGGANTDALTVDVEAAIFEFDDGEDPATAWSTSALNDLGQFTSDGDVSHTIVLKNTSAYSTGTLSASSNLVLTAAQPDMWQLNATACDAISVAGGATCDLHLSFKGANGLSGPGTYTATLTVTGQNGSAEETLDFQAQLMENFKIQDSGDSYNDVNGTIFNFGTVPNIDDVTRTFRIRNDSGVDSGTITVDFDQDVSGHNLMWTLVSDNCNGQEILGANPSPYCEITIQYNANSGDVGQGTGVHKSGLTVSSPVLGTSVIQEIRASRN